MTLDPEDFDGPVGMPGYFTPASDPRLYACGCQRKECDAPPVSTDLLARLNILRYRLGRALVVNSGPRCAVWNAKQGGARTSDHLSGEGADLRALTSGERDELLEAIYTRPRLFVRVGIGRDFIHVGLPGTERPARVAWTYYTAATA